MLTRNDMSKAHSWWSWCATVKAKFFQLLHCGTQLHLSLPKSITHFSRHDPHVQPCRCKHAECFKTEERAVTSVKANDGGGGVWESERPIAKEIQHGDKTVKSACTVVAASVCWHLSESVVHTTWMRVGWDHDSLWTSTQMVLPSSAPAHNFNCCSSLPEVFLSMLRKLNLRNDWTCRKCARKICTRKDLSWALLPSSHHPPPH
jgi:hypothetical protein